MVTLTFTLLLVTFTFVLGAQVSRAFFDRASLQATHDELTSAKVGLVEMYRAASSSEGNPGGGEIRKNPADLVRDLLVLSQTDPDARAIASKYELHQFASLLDVRLDTFSQRLVDFVLDLLILAKTDPDARAIATKHGLDPFSMPAGVFQRLPWR